MHTPLQLPCHQPRCLRPAATAHHRAQAARTDAIDILAVQAPQCRALPDALVELLHEARTSVLVYRPAPDGPESEGVSTSLAAAAPADDLASP